MFVALLALHYARASRPVAGHVEYAGIIPQLEQLAGTIGDDDLLIVESRDAGGDVHVLALPLAYIYARNVLVLHPAARQATFAAFLDWARTRYRRVLFLGGGGTDLLSRRYGVAGRSPASASRCRSTTRRSTRYPRSCGRRNSTTASTSSRRPTPRDGLWFDLDVGVRDDLHVLRFHAKEQTEGRTFRWTGDTSYCPSR